MNIDPTSVGLGLGGVERESSNDALVDSKQMGRDEFLTLLTAQIEQQDPLNPPSNHEFVAQLAQFSALEQQVQTNEKLDHVRNSQQSMANGQLSSLIGKEIKTTGTSMVIDGGVVPELNFELGSDASEVTVTIVDENGQAVDAVPLAGLRAGKHNIDWDGIDPDGVKVPDGRYTLEIEAIDASGNTVSARSLSSGKVLGVTFQNGYPELILDSGRILPSEIISITSSGDSTPTPAGDQQTPRTATPGNPVTGGRGYSNNNPTPPADGDTKDGTAHRQLRRFAPPILS